MPGFDPVTAVASVIDTVVKRIWPDASEVENAKLEALKIAMSSELAVHQINATEAAHPSIFVAGWRPFIGWTCGVSVAYTFVVSPFLDWICANTGVAPPPRLDTNELMGLLMALLGMGGLRTVEGLYGKKRSIWPGKGD